MFRLVLIFCLCFFINVQSSFAAFTVLQALHFGEYAVRDDDAQYVITVNPDGSYTYDASGFVLISLPQEGILELSELIPFTVITSIVVTEVSPLQGGLGVFEMFDFQTDYDTTADVNGDLVISIGASARTSGTGSTYSDETRTGTLQVDVYY